LIHNRPLRIGAVRYLNTKPLVHRLLEHLPTATLEFDLPSRLADRLASEQLDVALIPSFEFFRGDPGYSLISDAAIVSHGPVWSVKLLSRVPISEIRSLALDEGSRTSAVLVQVLLHELHGVRPHLVPLPIDRSPEDVASDATLLIGDRAMQPGCGQYHEIWDLGDRWHRMTHLPFVFAMWVARRDCPRQAELAHALAAARDDGLAAAELISAREAGAHGLTYEDCLAYFRRHLQFRLGAEELSGLKEFGRRSVRLGLLPATALQRVTSVGQDNGAGSRLESTAGHRPG
jgi:chorismate dehydratase